MKRLSLFLFLLVAASALAQQTSQTNSGFISATGQCVTVPAAGLSSAGYGVTGSWTGTLTASGVVGQGNPVSLGTATANGSYTASISGYTLFQVCGTSIASGAAFVQITASSASSGGGSVTPASVQSATQPGILAATYGVVGDGGFSFQCNYTSASPIVTCADAQFQTDAVVGEPFFGTSLTKIGFTTSSVLLTPANATILSIDSQTQIHLNQNATANCAVASTCFGVFAQLEDTQMTNAETAALNNCMLLQLPGANPRQDGPAVMAVLTGHFGGNTSNCLGAGGVNNGPGVVGQGRTSMVIVWPTATATPCTLGLSGAACFGGIVDGAQYNNFLLTGGGVSNPGASFANKIAFEIDSQNQAYTQNVQLQAWGQNASNGLMAGLYLRGQIRLLNTAEDQFGQVGCVIGPASGLGYVVWNQGSCYDNGFGNVFVSNSNLSLVSNGLSIGSPGGQGGTGATGSFGVCVNNGATWFDTGSQVGLHGVHQGQYGVIGGFCTLPTGLGGTVTATGNIYLNGTNVKGICGAPNGGPLAITGSGSVLHLRAVSAEASSTCFVLNSNATSLTFDDCGNTFLTNGGSLLVGGSSAPFGSCSITGTNLVVGNIAFTSGWGTSPSATVGAPANSQHSVFTITVGTTPGANPVATVTFPTPFFTAPGCRAQQVGGTQTVGVITTGATTSTSVPLTWVGTPTAGNTIQFDLQCSN